MRGKGCVIHYVYHLYGITPAYAGKRSSHAPRACIYRDHPRVCGEKVGPVGCVSGWLGSPPRMRGKGCVIHYVYHLYGITPAYAGKRSSHAPRACIYRDHPRVCGEKVGPVGCVSGWLGSPPRMRGKAGSHTQPNNEPGITPAYAGKRLCYPFFLSPLWDHPRVCGEKFDNPKNVYCK